MTIYVCVCCVCTYCICCMFIIINNSLVRRITIVTSELIITIATIILKRPYKICFIKRNRGGLKNKKMFSLWCCCLFFDSAIICTSYVLCKYCYPSMYMLSVAEFYYNNNNTLSLNKCVIYNMYIYYIYM